MPLDFCICRHKLLLERMADSLLTSYTMLEGARRMAHSFRGQQQEALSYVRNGMKCDNTSAGSRLPKLQFRTTPQWQQSHEVVLASSQHGRPLTLAYNL